MNLEMFCPNCGAKIGEIKEDGTRIYFYKGRDNKPVCQNCGMGKGIKAEKNIIIGTFLVIIIITIINIIRLIN